MWHDLHGQAWGEAEALPNNPPTSELDIDVNMKKSALSAALAGGPSAPAPSVQPSTKTSATFLDPSVFPCIEYADIIDGTKTVDELSAATDQFAGIDFASVAIVGSAPTNVLLNGVALVSAWWRELAIVGLAVLVDRTSNQPNPGRHSVTLPACRRTIHSTRDVGERERRRRRTLRPRW